MRLLREPEERTYKGPSGLVIRSIEADGGVHDDAMAAAGAESGVGRQHGKRSSAAAAAATGRAYARELWGRCLRGWDGIVDEKDVPIPFDPPPTFQREEGWSAERRTAEWRYFVMRMLPSRVKREVEALILQTVEEEDAALGN
jgi:hypothetical protein